MVGWLVDRLAKNLGANKDSRVAKALLHRKIRTGEFTLLVDAMDQLSRPDPEGKAVALSEFLSDICPNCRCVVSGRPPAIDRFWDHLFDKSQEWIFAQIDQFTDDQCEKYLGDKRFKLLKRLDADLVAVPRMLETLHRVPDDQLETIRTGSDIYWRAMKETLNKDVNLQQDSHKFETVLFWFSLLAFETLRLGNLNGVARSEEDPNAVEDFLDKVWKAHEAQIRKQYIRKQFDSFDDELKRLANLNSVLVFSVLNTSDVLQQIKFRDQTVRDFLAAIWVTKFAQESDVEWLGNNQFVRSKSVRRNNATKPYEAMWRFATEMPREPECFSDETYAQGMSVLFKSLTVTAEAQELYRKYRSTEMIYRSFPMMLKLSGYKMPANLNDLTMRDPIEAAQKDAQELVQELKTTVTPEAIEESREILKEKIDETCANNIAKHSLMTYLCEYPATLMLGINGTDAQRVATEFESWFQPVPQEPDASLKFSGRMGRSGEPFTAEVGAAFELCMYPTTNAVYLLYDFCSDRCENSADHPSLARYPVIYVDWYDSWAAAIYFGCRLPTGDEWYANRGPGEVDEPWPWCCEAEEELKHYAYFDRGPSTAAKLPTVENPSRKSHLGIYDMHGNVWEWVLNWHLGTDEKSRKGSREFDLTGRSRVSRGGSFYFGADSCCSSYRDGRRPGVAGHSRGVRFSRARKS